MADSFQCMTKFTTNKKKKEKKRKLQCVFSAEKKKIEVLIEIWH